MAKTKKSPTKLGGPFVAAAFFCNSITEDSDGVISAIRIVDEIHVAIRPDTPPDFPSKEKPVEMPLFALIMIRRGDARAGKHKLRLLVHRTDGTTKEASKQEVEFPANPNGTCNIRAKMAVKLYAPGVTWIEVILDGVTITKMPLNLVVIRPEQPAIADNKNSKPAAK